MRVRLDAEGLGIFLPRLDEQDVCLRRIALEFGLLEERRAPVVASRGKRCLANQLFNHANSTTSVETKSAKRSKAMVERSRPTLKARRYPRQDFNSQNSNKAKNVSARPRPKASLSPVFSSESFLITQASDSSHGVRRL